MSEVAIPSKGMSLLADLELSGAITETSLVLPPDVPYDQCEALAHMLGRTRNMTAWCLGDLLNYMEREHGETYAQASVITGLAPQTLMNYTSTCSRIPRSRRKSNVPFSIHSEVAWLTPEEQDRWLGIASQQGWTREVIREELAPLRTARKLERAQLNGSVPVEVAQSAIADQGGAHLPPAGSGSIVLCQCPGCGRLHRSDFDVTV
jgi:hypothetical protein